VIGAVVAGLLASGLAAAPAQAISKSEVEAVCADSQEAYDTYQAARASFAEATNDLETANLALGQAEAKEQRIRTQYDSNRTAREELAPRAESQAVELYMQSVGSGTAGLVALDKPEDALVAFEFIASASDDSMEALNDLAGLTSELDRLGDDLNDVVVERTGLRDDQQQLTAQQEQAMGSALDSYEQLTDDCKQIQADYEAEQARLRAEEEARERREEEARRRAESGDGGSGGSGGGSGGGGGGGSSRVVDGLVCPFTPGRTQFTNSYGAPRSGGRSHRGVDMMAPWDEPIYAVESGTVKLNTGGLGGNQIFLTGNSGAYYYYAHLNSFNVSSGTSVSQGDLIGFNGNSGNASGGAPHVHFQIYPNGYRGGVINPYHSMAAVCF
jgi:murein DD-endopeptidase MepM/ murein hydrolase activator NlpD